MKPRGFLILKEHDFKLSDSISMVVDILHMIYDIKNHNLSKNPDIIQEYLQNFFVHYYSRNELNKLMKIHGFRNMNYYYKASSYHRTYYAIYQKI